MTGPSGRSNTSRRSSRGGELSVTGPGHRRVTSDQRRLGRNKARVAAAPVEKPMAGFRILAEPLVKSYWLPQLDQRVKRILAAAMAGLYRTRESPSA
jgi:hypothetical protein